MPGWQERTLTTFDVKNQFQGFPLQDGGFDRPLKNMTDIHRPLTNKKSLVTNPEG